jgi:dihydroorotate dehydrogenase (NAD+) catalytic subunit
MIDLTTKIGPLTLPNPVMVASGTFGYADEFDGLADLSVIGGIITKTVTLEMRPGNPPPRIAETAGGMLNSIGLPNLGVEGFIAEKMPFLRTIRTSIIVNVAGKSEEEFAEVVARLEDVEGIHGYELNYSCPNVKEGGLSFSVNPTVAERLTQLVRNKTKKALITKLTPNVTSIAEIGRAVENGGADAVSAINTLVGMAVDVRTRKPRIATVTGGLSGPAIKPVALAKVYELCKAVKIPIIGIGGIMSAEDALEFLIVGASAIQVGTANFKNPAAANDVLSGVRKYCEQNGIQNISQMIGSLVTCGK